MSTKPPTDRITKLREQLQKKEQERQKVLREIARIETRDRKARRKKEDKQKYILGGDLQRRAEEDPKLQTLIDQIIKDLTRDQDRKAFDLEPLPQTANNENSPSHAMKKATT